MNGYVSQGHSVMDCLGAVVVLSMRNRTYAACSHVYFSHYPLFLKR